MLVKHYSGDNPTFFFFFFWSSRPSQHPGSRHGQVKCLESSEFTEGEVKANANTEAVVVHGSGDDSEARMRTSQPRMRKTF